MKLNLVILVVVMLVPFCISGEGHHHHHHHNPRRPHPKQHRPVQQIQPEQEYDSETGFVSAWDIIERFFETDEK